MSITDIQNRKRCLQIAHFVQITVTEAECWIFLVYAVTSNSFSFSAGLTCNPGRESCLQGGLGLSLQITAKQEAGVIVCGNWESGIRYVLVIPLLVLVTMTES